MHPGGILPRGHLFRRQYRSDAAFLLPRASLDPRRRLARAGEQAAVRQSALLLRGVRIRQQKMR